MKGYRKPGGIYIEVNDATPVASHLVEVAIQPSPNHTFADNWQSDPMNPAVCWRPKTTIELDTESDLEFDTSFEVTAKEKVILKQIFLLRKVNEPGLTQQQFKDELRADYRGFRIA